MVGPLAPLLSSVLALGGPDAGAPEDGLRFAGERDTELSDIAAFVDEGAGQCGYCIPGLVVAVTTRYSQPLIGFVFCIYVGWILHRDQLLQELRKGNPDIERGLFWKIWPWWVRLVCPAIILAIFARSLLA